MKLIVVMMMLIINLNAFDWMDYESAKKIAKQECKPIMLVAYKNGCPACTQFFSRIDNAKIASPIIKEGYITAMIDVNEAVQKYGTAIAKTPTILIVNYKGEELVPVIEGSPAEELEFVEFLQRARVLVDMEGCS